jgi:hypothetical protein
MSRIINLRTKETHRTLYSAINRLSFVRTGLARQVVLNDSKKSFRPWPEARLNPFTSWLDVFSNDSTSIEFLDAALKEK